MTGPFHMRTEKRTLGSPQKCSIQSYMHVDETNLVISFKLKDVVNAFTDLTDDLHRICQRCSNYQGAKKIISTACHLRQAS